MASNGRRGYNGRGTSLMQIAASIVGSVGATQVIRPRCPVVNGPCPGNDRGVTCSSSCSTDEDNPFRHLDGEPDVGYTDDDLLAQGERPRCYDPHCPDFGDPSFGEGTCPAEHADAWRFRFKGDAS